jgi:hypothetical protein
MSIVNTVQYCIIVKITTDLQYQPLSHTLSEGGGVESELLDHEGARHSTSHSFIAYFLLYTWGFRLAGHKEKCVYNCALSCNDHLWLS